jgi:hypothetical protein
MARPKARQQSSRRSALASKIQARWGEAGGDIAVDRVIAELDNVQRYDIVAALRELERVGVGTFVVGRAGHKARFVWSSRKASTPVGPAVTRPESRTGSAAAAPAMGARPLPKPRGGSRAAATRPARSTRDLAERVALATKPRSTPAAATLDHRFHLRPGYIVAVSLPGDVTRTEVDRFCQFLQAIPFEPTS